MDAFIRASSDHGVSGWPTLCFSFVPRLRVTRLYLWQGWECWNDRFLAWKSDCDFSSFAKAKGRELFPAFPFAVMLTTYDERLTTVLPYFVLPPSTPSFSVAAACAAARRAVSTRNGEQET